MSAHTDNERSEAAVDVPRLVRVWMADRVEAGSCNACHNRDESDVMVLSFNGAELRACSKCRQSLFHQLENFCANDHE